MRVVVVRSAKHDNNSHLGAQTSPGVGLSSSFDACIDSGDPSLEERMGGPDERFGAEIPFPSGPRRRQVSTASTNIHHKSRTVYPRTPDEPPSSSFSFEFAVFAVRPTNSRRNDELASDQRRAAADGRRLARDIPVRPGVGARAPTSVDTSVQRVDASVQPSVQPKCTQGARSLHRGLHRDSPMPDGARSGASSSPTLEFALLSRVRRSRLNRRTRVRMTKSSRSTRARARARVRPGSRGLTP
jgi:hypothetical protein